MSENEASQHQLSQSSQNQLPQHQLSHNQDDGHGRHEADEPAIEPPPRLSFLAELRDAVSARTVLLVLGVLLLQLGFILSYVGAFHAPKPQRIPVVVVAPAQVSTQLIGQLNALPSNPLSANAIADEAIARQQILDGTTSAALIVDPKGTADTLLVASGGGTSVAQAVEEVGQQVARQQKRALTVTDIVPLQSGDGRGLSGFYLVIGWLVGGYLMAALLGMAKGARPTTTRRALFRLFAVVPYAILSGLGGAIVVDQGLGALTGHFMALWWLGALLVFGAAAVTLAFQVLFGVIGIGVTVLLFVILGNPSAGGAYQPTLLPPFWRALSGALPNGAGTDIVRRIVYFGSQGIGGHLIVLAGYAIGGVVVALGAATLLHRKASARDPEAGQPVI